MPIPAVTVLMASYNSAAFIMDALATILSQSLRDIEVVVVDDGSTDGSREIVAAIAQSDPRVRCFAAATRGGPAAARNIGLDQARGRWIAVVDSDDLLHPERLERLLHLAEAEDTDIAADNLLVFDEEGMAPPTAFLAGGPAKRVVDLAEYVLSNAYGRGGATLGYLKPLIRTAFIRASGVRYRPELRIAQDFGFVLSLMGAGARFHIMPDLTYFYRKHAGSNSHRLVRANVEAMIDDDRSFLAQHPAAPPRLAHAFAARRKGFQAALAFDDLVQAVKTRRWARAAALGIAHPQAALMLRESIGVRIGRLRRRLRPAPPPPASREQVCIISRRPITADAEHVLAPLLSLAATISAAGAAVHLVIPGAVRAPQRVALARTPGIKAFATVNMRSGRTSEVPPGESWSIEDKLFVARYARPLADVIVADWLPGLEAIPFALRPSSLALVLVDGLPPPAPTPDLAKLRRADAILTLRPEDAARLQPACGTTPIILLPTGQTVCGIPSPMLAAFIARVWPSA